MPLRAAFDQRGHAANERHMGPSDEKFGRHPRRRIVGSPPPIVLASQHNPHKLQLMLEQSEPLSLVGVTTSDGTWKLSFKPDSAHLECTSGASSGQQIIVSRDTFFRELEYREWLDLLVILRPKRIGLRLSGPDQARLREWLGPPGEAEVSHVVGLRLRGALLANLALAGTVLFYSWDGVFLAIATFAAANTIATYLRPRAWQLLAETLTALAMALTLAMRMWTGQHHSMLLDICLLVWFLVSARNAWRTYRLLTIRQAR